MGIWQVHECGDPVRSAGFGAAEDCRRGGGFTLLEMVVVLGIVATLSAIAVPRYGASVARYRADVTARRVAADLDFARSMARQTSQSVTVVFDYETMAVRIPGVTHLNRRSSDYATLLEAGPHHAKLVSDTLGLDHRVVFDGYGVPDREGFVIVRVGDVERVVTVEAGQAGALVE